MQRVIQCVIALSFVSNALAAFGDVRITGGGKSGRLEFQGNNGVWGTVCRSGFDDDAGDVACSQLGYVQSSDVYNYTSSSSTQLPAILCSADCDGDEDKLRDCSLHTSSTCGCGSNIVGITCTNSLTAGQIVGIVIGVLVFVGLIATCVTLCICCLKPSCPCYYRSYRTTRTVVYTPQVMTSTTTTANTTNYQPPPAYNVDGGYQQYPTTATTGKY